MSMIRDVLEDVFKSHAFPMMTHALQDKVRKALTAPEDVEAIFVALGRIIPPTEPAPWWLTRERFIAAYAEGKPEQESIDNEDFQ